MGSSRSDKLKRFGKPPSGSGWSKSMAKKRAERGSENAKKAGAPSPRRGRSGSSRPTGADLIDQGERQIASSMTIQSCAQCGHAASKAPLESGLCARCRDAETAATGRSVLTDPRASGKTTAQRMKVLADPQELKRQKREREAKEQAATMGSWGTWS